VGVKNEAVGSRLGEPDWAGMDAWQADKASPARSTAAGRNDFRYLMSFFMGLLIMPSGNPYAAKL
jgi:hypothetical protein